MICFKAFIFSLLVILFASLTTAYIYFKPGLFDFSHYNLEPIARDNISDIPLDPESPWPKFRANALQNGRSPINGKNNALPHSLYEPWIFPTGKGIFSSAVVDAEGTAYIGSADHYFYAIRADGTLKWNFLTKEIIDSAALLDDRHRVYFGSGDGHVYALNRDTGELLWKSRAHSPAEVEKLHKIKLYNLAWFEGNVAMLKDGTLVAGNDNYLYYLLSRDDGKEIKHLVSNEMGWSLPAVNTKTERLFFGTTFLGFTNIKAFNSETGSPVWTNGALGSISASPLLTSSDPMGGLVISAFDGYVRAFAQRNGKELWNFATRDHIYASSAQLSDGTIITPSTDGSVYALKAENGSLLWAFNSFHLSPIRSSPAVDGQDRIYFGAGDGRLYAINKNGTLAWAYQCNSDDRSDLNSSPALGPHGVYIGGENGGLCFVPYDYCESRGEADKRCYLQVPKSAKEGLQAEGLHLSFTTSFGKILDKAPETIEANEALAFTISLQQALKAETVLIDKNSLEVTWSGDAKATVNLSANRTFITIVPESLWAPENGGSLDLTISGNYLTKPWRLGLKSFFGTKSGTFKKTFSFQVKARPHKDVLKMPYAIPKKVGDPATTFVVSRIAVPNPTMLPSLNQIGFDSIHYLGGLVEGNEKQAVIFMVGARHDGASGKTVVDPKSSVRFALDLEWLNGLLTIKNDLPFTLKFNGTWAMPYLRYRLATTTNAEGQIEKSPNLAATVNCDDIASYGRFLKFLGLSEIDSGQMHIYGAANMAVLDKDINAPVKSSSERGHFNFELHAHEAKVSIKESKIDKDKVLSSLLLIDATSGRPIILDYETTTSVVSDPSGAVTEVSVAIKDKNKIKGPVRIYYMLDSYPAASATLEF